jgi:hypothetical protein
MKTIKKYTTQADLNESNRSPSLSCATVKKNNCGVRCEQSTLRSILTGRKMNGHPPVAQFLWTTTLRCKQWNDTHTDDTRMACEVINSSETVVDVVTHVERAGPARLIACSWKGWCVVDRAGRLASKKMAMADGGMLDEAKKIRQRFACDDVLIFFSFSV